MTRQIFLRQFQLRLVLTPLGAGLAESESIIARAANEHQSLRRKARCGNPKQHTPREQSVIALAHVRVVRLVFCALIFWCCYTSNTKHTRRECGPPTWPGVIIRGVLYFPLHAVSST